MSPAAKNPYQPGVGTLPRYLAGRQGEMDRFRRLLRDYPEKRKNCRMTGLRGVGKTVLLKQFEKQAKDDGWAVVRRDLSPRANAESEMAAAMTEFLREAAEELAPSTKLKHLIADAMSAIGDLQLELEGVTVGIGGQRQNTTALETRIFKALLGVGKMTAKSGRGFALLLDEAHTVADRPKAHQWPLYALVAAFVRVQDQEDPPFPIMLVTCGLPPLTDHLQAARSHSERFFRGEVVANLELAAEPGHVSEAALALTRPAEGTGIAFDTKTATRIARDVDGYPYFLQYYGEALWDAARDAGSVAIDDALYDATRQVIRRALDQEFFEARYHDVRLADQLTLRMAADLGTEEFKVSDLNAALQSRKPNANAQSLNRLVGDNVIFRDKQGVYAYTAPLFGDFVRRRHPRLPEDV